MRWLFTSGLLVTGLLFLSAAPADDQAAAADGQAGKTATSALTPLPLLPSPPDCLRETGSHIKPASGCLPMSPGRSYSREQIENTGASDISTALEHLDPSITIYHH